MTENGKIKGTESIEECINTGRSIAEEMLKRIEEIEQSTKTGGRIDSVSLQVMFDLSNRLNKCLYSMMVDKTNTRKIEAGGSQIGT